MATIDTYLDELLAPEPPPPARMPVAGGAAAACAESARPEAWAADSDAIECAGDAAHGNAGDRQATAMPMDGVLCDGVLSDGMPCHNAQPDDVPPVAPAGNAAHDDDDDEAALAEAFAKAAADEAALAAAAAAPLPPAVAVSAGSLASLPSAPMRPPTPQAFDGGARAVPPAPVRAPAVPDLSAFMPPPGAAISPVARLAAGMGRTRTATGGHRWLRVRVGGDSYAFELLRVQEVVRLAPIVAMRGAAHAVLGVMNLRGRIVPVFDLGLWLDVGAVHTDEHSRIVVIERNDELIGVLVTMVEDVVSLEREHVEPPLAGSDPGPTLGVARVTAAPTVLLDADALFD